MNEMDLFETLSDIIKPETMKKEYRKKSAEVLGFDFYKNPKLSEPFFVLIDNGEETSSPIAWHPDKDANQMLMVINYLRSEGVAVNMRLRASLPGLIYPSNIALQRDFVIYKEGKENLESLVMKAFMEYINQT